MDGRTHGRRQNYIPTTSSGDKKAVCHNGVARTIQKFRTLKRDLEKAVILFNCVPFHMGTSLKRKNLLPEGANSFL